MFLKTKAILFVSEGANNANNKAKKVFKLCRLLLRSLKENYAMYCNNAGFSNQRRDKDLPLRIAILKNIAFQQKHAFCLRKAKDQIKL